MQLRDVVWASWAVGVCLRSVRALARQLPLSLSNGGKGKQQQFVANVPYNSGACVTRNNDCSSEKSEKIVSETDNHSVVLVSKK